MLASTVNRRQAFLHLVATMGAVREDDLEVLAPSHTDELASPGEDPAITTSVGLLVISELKSDPH